MRTKKSSVIQNDKDFIKGIKKAEKTDLSNAMNQEEQWQRMQDALSTLSELSHPFIDRQAFYQDCVKQLAKAYNAGYAFIAVFSDDSKKRVHTLAVQANHQQAANFAYELADTPCEDVFCYQQVFVAKNVEMHYPKDQLLRDMQLESYLGASLIDSNGTPIGIVVVVHTQAMHEAIWVHPLLSLFTSRIALEVEREQAEHELKREANVFRHSTQGMMIVSTELKILKVNAAFYKITGYSDREIIDQDVRILHSQRHPKSFFENIIHTLGNNSVWQGEIWKRRKNKEIYPEYCTMLAVPKKNGGLSHYISMFQDISEQKFASERIFRLAYYDGITDLPNRMLLQKRLSTALNTLRKKQENTQKTLGLAVVFLDIDGFKHINDTLGHSSGDTLLRLLAQRLEKLLPPPDLVAHAGGDEFILVPISFGYEKALKQFAQKLSQTITQPFYLDEEKIALTASIGISLYPENGQDVQSLIKQADAAMYRAKALGKNQVVYYHSQLLTQANEWVKISSRLQGALENEELKLFYQPQYCLKDGRFIGMEALLRWQYSKGEVLPTERSIMIAEESGLIIPIGEWVLRHACQQAQAWREQGLETGKLAINFSARQFNDDSIIGTLENVLKHSGFPTHLLHIEVTESWMMSDPEKSLRIMYKLKEMGIHLVIDDFGVAYSSMNYLKRFPIDKLKIDRSFISGLPYDNDDIAIVSAIISMGHSLRLNVLAEGIETQAQHDFLTELGCNEGQGFLYAKPLPANKIKKILPKLVS